MTDQLKALNRLRQDLESTEDNLMSEEIIALSRARAEALSSPRRLFQLGFYPSMALLALLIATATLFDKSFYAPVDSEHFNQTTASLEPEIQAITNTEIWPGVEDEELDVYYWLAESTEALDELYGWNYK